MGQYLALTLDKELKQQKCIFSQFWRPEVWAQGVSRSVCSGGYEQGPMRKGRLLGLHVPSSPASPHIAFPLCVSASLSKCPIL